MDWWKGKEVAADGSQIVVKRLYDFLDKVCRVGKHNMDWWKGKEVEAHGAQIVVKRLYDFLDKVSDNLLKQEDSAGKLSMDWRKGTEVEACGSQIITKTLYDFFDKVCRVPERPVGAPMRMPISSIYKSIFSDVALIMVLPCACNFTTAIAKGNLKAGEIQGQTRQHSRLIKGTSLRDVRKCRWR